MDISEKEKYDQLQAEVEYQKGLKDVAYNRADKLQAENKELEEALNKIHSIAGTIEGKGTKQAAEIWDIIKQLNLDLRRK